MLSPVSQPRGEVSPRTNAVPEGAFWNVNLPDGETYLKALPDALQTGELPEIRYTVLDPHPLAVRYEKHERSDGDLYSYAGIYQQRKRQPGSDVDQCFSGYIAVTRVSGAS